MKSIPGAISRRVGDGSGLDRERPRDVGVAERLALVTFAVLVVGAPQLLGGALAWTTVLIAAFAMISLGLAVWALPSERARLHPAFAGLLLVPLWTFLQGVYWPCDWVAAVAPGAAQQARLAHALLNAGELARCSLSADPGNTQFELIKWSGILCAFVTSLLWTRAGRGRDVLRAVGLSALLMACSALGHWGADADRVYGLFTPPSGLKGMFLAPLLNPNNLGGFLVMGSGVLIGLAMSATDPREAVSAWAATALTSSMAVLTFSRGASAGVSLLALLFAGFALRRRLRRKKDSRTALLPLRLAVLPLIVLAGGMGMALFAAQEPLGAALAEDDLSKVQLWREALPLLAEHPLLGLGRGAFSAAFTTHFGSQLRFAYVENFVLQWALEWGIPLSLLLLTALFVWVGRPLLTTRSTLTFGAAAGTAVLLVQNLFDLALELSAPSVVAAVCVGALGGRRRRRRHTRAFQPVVLVGLTALALMFYGPGSIRYSVRALKADLAQASRAGDGDRFRELLDTGMRLHPQEAVLPYQGAVFALSRSDRSAAALVNRALSLAPHWAGTHSLAAQLLWRGGHRRQAAEQVRSAFALDAGGADAIACEVAKREPELVKTMVPKEGPMRRLAINMVTRCLPQEHPLRRELDQVLIADYPDEEAAFAREARALHAAGQTEQALSLLAGELAREPAKATVWAQLAELYMAEGRISDAARALDQGVAAAGPEPRLLLVQARLQAAQGNVQAMRTSWAHYRAATARKPVEAAGAFAVLGSLEERVGELDAAIKAYLEAHRMGGALGPLVRAAQVSEKAGRIEEAARWWRRACTLAPKDAAVCAESARVYGLLESRPP